MATKKTTTKKTTKKATKKKAAKKTTKKAAKKTTKKAATKKTAKKATKKTATKKTAAKKTATKKTAAKKATKKAAKKTVAKKAPAKKVVVASPPVADQNGIIEETVLNWTDLTGARTGASKFGSNKFYKAWIEEVGGRFRITFNYGRVGQRGQTKIEWAGTVDSARRILQSKVRKKMAKGYRKVEIRSEAEERAKAKAKGVQVEGEKKKKKTKPSRTFHPEVEGLLKLMYNATGSAVRKGLSSAAGASKASPLGNLSDTQLDKGADILDDIEKLLKRNQASKNQFINLTNDYLSNIPRNIDHARKGGRLDIDAILLNNEERVAEQRKFLTLLRDLHLQKDVFKQAAEADHPVEVWYDGLGCDLDWVEVGSDEFKRVAGYFDKGQSPRNSNFYNKLKVFKVWKLERKNKLDKFLEYAKATEARKGATGRIVGWHGTRTENLMGISKSGLLMPENLPKGVHITGKAFGKGIYHAPCWPDAGENRKAKDGKTYKRYNGALKSMNYTSLSGAYYGTSNTGRRGYMYLEEISLGVPEIHLTACWDRPRPAKGYDYIYAQAFGNPRLSHDEIVTFDERASRLTHLLEIGHKR